MADKWLKLAQEAYESSTTYIEANWRKDWDYSLRAFRNEHASDSKYVSEEFKARSRLFRPKTRAIIRKNEAAGALALFSNSDIVNVTPGNPDDLMNAASSACMKEILEYRLSRTLPTFQLVIGALQDAQTTGTVCSYQYWDYLVRPDGRKIKDQPCIELRPVENIRLDAGASWVDPVGTSPYFCDIIPMYVCDVRAMMRNKNDKTGDPVWKKFDDDVIRKARPTAMESIRQARLGGLQDPEQETTGIKEFDIVWVMRWFMKDSQGEDNVFYTLGTEAQLSDALPLGEVYFHGKRPYVMGCSVIETHTALKGGIPILVKPVQQEINDVANQRLDNVKFVLNKRWLVARGRQVDVQSLVRNVPGGVTLVSDPKTDVIAQDWEDVTSSSYVEHDRLNAELDDLAGNFSPSTRVANNAVNDTLGGSRMASQGAGLMSDYLIRTVIETWWAPVLRQLVLLESEYETDEVVLGVCANKARLFPKFGMSAITDTMLKQEIIVNVNVAMGASDPNARMAKFLAATNAAVQLRLQAPPGANIVEMTKEIYSNAGYRDGARFFNDKVDPQLARAMQAVQQLKGLLEGKQLELQAESQIKSLQIASNERLKSAEIQVDATRIDGDLRIRQSELQIEAQKLELEKLKLQIEAGTVEREAQGKFVELQAKIEEQERKLENERIKLAAEIEAERRNAMMEIEKAVMLHGIKMAGMLEVETMKAKAAKEGKDESAKRDAAASETASRREAEKVSKEISVVLAKALEKLSEKSTKKIILVKQGEEVVGAEVTAS